MMKVILNFLVNFPENTQKTAYWLLVLFFNSQLTVVVEISMGQSGGLSLHPEDF